MSEQPNRKKEGEEKSIPPSTSNFEKEFNDITDQLCKIVEQRHLRCPSLSWHTNPTTVVDLSSIQVTPSYIKTVLSEENYTSYTLLDEISAGLMDFNIHRKEDTIHFSIDFGFSHNTEEELLLEFFMKFCNEEEKREKILFKSLFLSDQQISLTDNEYYLLTKFVDETAPILVKRIEDTINNDLHLLEKTLIDYLNKKVNPGVL